MAGDRMWWLRVLIEQGFCPCPLRGFIIRGADFRSQVRSVYSRAQWRSKRSPITRAALVMLGAAWPLHATVSAAYCTYKHGRLVQVERRRVLQFLDQMRLAMRYTIPPSSYYLFEMHRTELRMKATDFIHQHEMLAILRQINGKTGRDWMSNKRRFAEFFGDRGFPIASCIATFRAGKVHFFPQSSDANPKCDLFAKPTGLNAGRGAMSWKKISDDRYQNLDGHQRSWDELLDHLREESLTSEYILQRRLVNHPEHAQFTLGGLCTIRVLTQRRRDGSIDVPAAVFKMPVGHSAVDNFAAGSMAAPIEVDSGKLGLAAQKKPHLRRLEHHPDTGELIRGVRLHAWEAVKELALSAHQQAPEHVLIGWDIAVTPDGPTLVEGNLMPCFELMQCAYNKPLGERVFGEYCRQLSSSP
jgi:hypothetical protein